MAQAMMEKIPDSLGYLIMNEDGAIMSSSGDLENDEKTADRLMNIVRTAVKVPTTDSDAAMFKQVSVVWQSFMYVMTISNRRVFVCKRQNNPPEPIAV